jgi:hypothetical protein
VKESKAIKMAMRNLCAKRKLFFNLNQNLKSARSISIRSCVNDKIATSQSSELKLNSWDKAVEEAVKCVGYQTPYLTLRYLTNDKDVHWNDHMGKLEGSNHPMCETVK